MNWSIILKDKYLAWANNDPVLVERLTDKQFFYKNELL